MILFVYKRKKTRNKLSLIKTKNNFQRRKSFTIKSRKVDSLDLVMREPIIFYCRDTFLRSSKTGTKASEKESILRNFITSGVWERRRRFGIKNFIIHLRVTQTLIEIRLFKANRSWAMRISYLQNPDFVFRGRCRKIVRDRRRPRMIKIPKVFLLRIYMKLSFSSRSFRVEKPFFRTTFTSSRSRKENSSGGRKIYFSASFISQWGEKSWTILSN